MPQTNDGVFQFNAAVENYSVHNVSTKASDTDINELTMLIFTEKGDIVGRPVNIPGSNPTFLVDTKEGYIWDPNAVGDAQRIPINNDADDLHKCNIYMVANSWEILKNRTDIKTLDELKSITLPVIGIDVPEGGFPMIGKQAEGVTFDLAKNKLNGSADGSTLATITMKKLYAMVNVRIQVIADMVVSTPSFTLKDWQVFNIPGSVSLGEPTSGQSSLVESYIPYSQESTILTAGDKLVEHTVSGSDYLEFSFYMPEHYLYAKSEDGQTAITRDNWGKYPASLPEDAYQRYKPLLCNANQKPTYVRVHGSYKDHQGDVKEVLYDIYLGQNPVDDFCVKRNQQLNNTITIKGITDRKPDEYPDDYEPSDDNISIDHRVDVVSEGFVISMEREAVMDSHFEVRPMDFMISDGARIVVTIDDDSNTDPSKKVWMRFEQSGNTSYHISGVGVRKYFTTDLISTLNAPSNKTLTITSDTRLWLYFDENTNVYDSFLDTDEANSLPKWRDIKLKVDYYAPDNNTSTPDKPMVYTFRQWHLWRIRDKSNTRYYDIEHEEEYLHNYASDDNYGKTTDGMAWGLNGIQLSHIYNACYIKIEDSWFDGLAGLNKQEVTNLAIAKLGPKYDFYLSRDTSQDELEIRDFMGYQFNKEITNYLLEYYGTDASAKLNGIALNEDPQSAIAYCYNKNKRQPDGSIKPEDVHWYLPASDEIELIAENAYNEFNGVFQGNLYWSCQPAYTNNKFLLNHYRYIGAQVFGYWVGDWQYYNEDVLGNYYLDDIYRARATRALVTDSGQFAGILPSGADERGTQNGKLYASGQDGAPNNKTIELTTYDITNSKPYEGYPGNLSRTEDIARVRCVYKMQ